MEELILLLINFNEILKKQKSVYLEFLTILDSEELAIANYNISEIEKIIILKDQQLHIAQALEEKRLILIKKLCYMIAFDARGQKLSLNVFSEALAIYVKNIKTLVTEDIYLKVLELEQEFKQISSEFEKAFKIAQPRIYRNQIVLKKLLRNINISIGLFQTAADVGQNYDSLGKTQSSLSLTKLSSSLRVRA